MRKEAHIIPKFEQGFEAVGWILTAVLLAAALWLPEAAARPQRARLIAIAAALGGANLLFHRLTSGSSEGRLPYRQEDRALVVSVGMVTLLTAYLYALPDGPLALTYLYLLPVTGAVLVLQARVVFAGALFSILAMLFLRAVGEAGAFWTPELAVRLIIFSVVSGCLAAVTAGLRRAYLGAERLSIDLSRRLDQIQVIGSLARQSELTPKLDQLASRAGEIIADAIGSERCAIFVLDGNRDKELRQVGDALAIDRRDRGILAAEENAKILHGVLETGVARIIDAVAVYDARIRNMLVLPLRVRQASIGVICLLNRRGDDVSFRQEEVHYSQLLADLAASLLNGALLFQRTIDERHTVEQMAKLLVGREIKMRELKSRLREGSDL